MIELSLLSFNLKKKKSGIFFINKEQYLTSHYTNRRIYHIINNDIMYWRAFNFKKLINKIIDFEGKWIINIRENKTKNYVNLRSGFRWKSILKKKISNQKKCLKRISWETIEILELLKGVIKYGRNWKKIKEIGNFFPSRTPKILMVKTSYLLEQQFPCKIKRKLDVFIDLHPHRNIIFRSIKAINVWRILTNNFKKDPLYYLYSLNTKFIHIWNQKVD